MSVPKGELFYRCCGHGKPIILVHGGPGMDHGYLLPQMCELARDHHLIFYDQRGSGRSLQNSYASEFINIAQFVEDLDYLRSGLNLGKVTVLGHSWGGFLAMHYALKYQNNLEAMILVGTVPANFLGQQEFLKAFQERTSTIQHKINRLFNLSQLEGLTPDMINQSYRELFSVYCAYQRNIEQLTLDITKESAVGGFHVMQYMLETSYCKPECNLFPDLPDIDVPTLIIHGQQDIIPMHTAEAICRALPKAQLDILENCGHFPYVEAADPFFSSIRGFLAQLGQA